MTDNMIPSEATLVGRIAQSVEAGERCPKCGAPVFDLVAHLQRQRVFSLRTFGPGERTKGLLEHIRKELEEIEKDPHDLVEWIDVAILAFDGAWRHGFAPEEIAKALADKQAVNESRDWPDWRTVPEDRAIEHNRSRERDD